MSTVAILATVITDSLRFTQLRPAKGTNQTDVPKKKAAMKRSAPAMLPSPAARMPSATNGGQRPWELRRKVPDESDPKGTIPGMIETLYKTQTPEKGRSECYVLVLSARPASEGKVYVFMEEHGRWDDVFERFICEVTSISTESDLTHKEALAMYDKAKQKLAGRGFVHAFGQDNDRKQPREREVGELELLSA